MGESLFPKFTIVAETKTSSSGLPLKKLPVQRNTLSSLTFSLHSSHRREGALLLSLMLNLMVKLTISAISSKTKMFLFETGTELVKDLIDSSANQYPEWSLISLWNSGTRNSATVYDVEDCNKDQVE